MKEHNKKKKLKIRNFENRNLTKHVEFDIFSNFDGTCETMQIIFLYEKRARGATLSKDPL